MRLTPIHQDEEKIIFRVAFDTANPQLDAAFNPGFSGNETYITIVRGYDPFYRIFYRNNHVSTFGEGSRGQDLAYLKRTLMEALAYYGINHRIKTKETSNLLSFRYERSQLKKITLGGALFLNVPSDTDNKDYYLNLFSDYTPQSNEWINESIEIQHAVYEPKPFDADHVFTKG